VVVAADGVVVAAVVGEVPRQLEVQRPGEVGVGLQDA